MEIQLGCYPQVFMLTLARTAAIIFALPFFDARIELQIRVGLALAITLALLPVLPDTWIQAAQAIHSLPEILLALLNEVLLGAAIGLICSMFVGACQIAGEFMGLSNSLSAAESLDPFSGISSPAMVQIMTTVFLLMILLSNSHLALLRMLGASFRTLPPTMTWISAGLGEHIVALGTSMFTLGVGLAMPLIAAALLVDICFALVARLAPEVNILFLSLPVRLTIGFALFGLTLRYSAGSFARMIEQMLEQCARVIL
ncbi:MAG: flagellar biosynthetic protein FliR [bacterium]